MTNPHLSKDQQIVGDVYTNAESMAVLSHLCDEFGSRFGGTEGEHRAAEYIQAKLSEYGLKDVHLEPIEYLGSYDPHQEKDEDKVSVYQERVEYWLSKGAQPTETVAQLLRKVGLKV